MAGTLKLTPHETLTIRRSELEVLEVEAVYGPGGSPPPAHLHPSQDEHFEVLAGQVRARVDGDDRTLSTGEAIDIPRGTKHQMWNASSEEARVLWQTRPPGRTEEWFGGIDRLIRENGDQMPGPAAFATMLTEYRAVFRLAVAPDPMLRPVVAAPGAV